jgi:hypothetical protein
MNNSREVARAKAHAGAFIIANKKDVLQIARPTHPSP